MNRKVSNVPRKVPPIEAVSHLRPANNAYACNTPKDYGGGTRLVVFSLPRVRWLERPEIEVGK